MFLVLSDLAWAYEAYRGLFVEMFLSRTHKLSGIETHPDEKRQDP